MPTPSALSERHFRRAALAVLCAAAALRTALGLLMPAIARDGVTFCWYARELATHGPAHLQRPGTDQHPLYPLAIAGVHGMARTLGVPSGPYAWQYSGQLVASAAGLAAIVLSGVLAREIVRRLALPLDERWAALLSMLMTALLPLNNWLASDVMSEQLHLLLYLGALVLLVRPPTAAALLGAGLLSGLAFLTREEGFVPVLAGLAVLWRRRKGLPLARLGGGAVALLAGFLVCAAPYWAIVGGFSSKKGLRDLVAPARTAVAPSAAAHDPAGRAAPAPARASALALPLAKLEITDHAWYALVPVTIHELFRAGRVVVPLLALLPLINLRRRFCDPALLPLTCCFLAQLALGVLVLGRYGYLSPRHLLVPIMLLVPFAAFLLTRVVTLVGLRRGTGIVGVCLLPLLLYSLRIPNHGDRYLADAARWLRTQDPHIAEHRVVSGSSARRIAFYTDAQWEYWPEQPEVYSALQRRLRADGPGWFVLETGPGYERTGNAELLDKLRADPHLRGRLGASHARPGPEPAITLWLLELVAPPYSAPG